MIAEQLRKALQFVGELMHVNPIDIMGGSRERRIVISRHLVRYYLRKRHNITWTEMGRVMKCTHATIIHSIKFIEETAQVDLYINTLKQSVDYLKLPTHFSMREKLLHALKCHSTNNCRVEHILEIVREHYEEAEQQKKMVAREEEAF